jgi:hypothetical protein
LSEACKQELNTSFALQKTAIIMCHPQFAAQLQPFAPNLIVIDPTHPDLAESGIVQYLKAVDAEQTTKRDLLALGTLALGLLIFAPSN